MKKKSVAFASCGVLAALVLGSFLFSAQSPKSASNPTTYLPKKKESNSLDPEKKSSNTQILSQSTKTNLASTINETNLNSTAKKCLESEREKVSIQGQIAACSAAAPGSAFFDSCEEKKNRLRGGLSQMADSDAVYDSNPSALEIDFYKATVTAAEAGNTDARLCYVEALFDIGRPWTHDEISKYQIDAKSYADAAFTRGDWRVVQLMTTSSRMLSYIPDNLISNILGNDPTRMYKMTKLLSLGATGNYLNQVNDQLPIFGAILSQEQLQKADAWAAYAYSSYFQNSPVLNAPPVPCTAQM